ncbi:hypothetical protein NRIC_20390 [Enterococcus florum]|uniref:Uncharacterized protein n=1 Tax=Enterococcus florum TaxID=2480627 RepID=A0A4P5PDL9_9ENTE|nr:hypothetical protein [Enterococcus florum]GCF94148.1 hypothetical protein NRIC_20390 [Enterococcus florum]
MKRLRLTILVQIILSRFSLLLKQMTGTKKLTLTRSVDAGKIFYRFFGSMHNLVPNGKANHFDEDGQVIGNPEMDTAMGKNEWVAKKRHTPSAVLHFLIRCFRKQERRCYFIQEKKQMGFEETDGIGEYSTVSQDVTFLSPHLRSEPVRAKLNAAWRFMNMKIETETLRLNSQPFMNWIQWKASGIENELIKKASLLAVAETLSATNDVFLDRRRDSS